MYVLRLETSLRAKRFALLAAVFVLASFADVRPALAINCTSPADCLSKMTLDEKIGQMTQANKNALTSTGDIATFFLGSLLSGGGEGPSGQGGTAAQWADMYDNFQNISQTSRLAIPLIYGVDAVHGHNNVTGAVVFPHNIGMGATRNTALMQNVAAAVRDEVLGTGMNWAFAPCVCVPRDDRWGRTYEGFSEDTTVTRGMGTAAIRGFQGAGLGPTTVMATAKHFVGDGGTSYGTGSSGYLIDQGNTVLSEADLRAIHLPPFQDAVSNGVGSVMISYSSWNGLKMHAQQYLITTVLKGELGFGGIVVSDWAGVDQVSSDYAVAVRTAINAGIDMVMVPSDYRRFITTLRNEVNAGRVSTARINDAVTRILTKKFALGLPTKFRTDRSYTSQVGSAAHRTLARQAVRESMVLLKNGGAVLPLSKTATYKIVVGGSHVDNLGYQMGGWSISWLGGSGNTTTGGTTFWQAIQAAKPASVTLQNVGTNTASTYTGDIGIAVIGETPYAEGVGDSSSLALSTANINQVNDICSRTTKCIVILMSGRPLVVTNQLARSWAFIAAWLPGTEGRGITDVLFGDYPFTGKLPMSWPGGIGQEPINNGDGKWPLFPLGYGLSGASPVLSTTAWYRFMNHNSGKCVDDAAFGTTNGSIVQQWGCGAGINQQWQFVATDSGFYRIMSRQAPTLAIDVSGAATGNSAQLQLWTYGGGANQQWFPQEIGNGFYRFIARHSGRCIDVPGSSAADGVRLQQYDCNGTMAQTFSVQPQ